MFFIAAYFLASCQSTHTQESISSSLPDGQFHESALPESCGIDRYEASSGDDQHDDAGSRETEFNEDSLPEETGESDFSWENSSDSPLPEFSEDVTPPEINSNITDPVAVRLLYSIIDLSAKYYDVSVYYCDTKTGYYFYHETNKSYPCASTIKAIYCHYLIQAGTNLYQEITLKEVSQSSASGKLTESAVGTSFTVKSLIEFSIVYSDNMAYRLLYQTFGTKGFNEYIHSLGLDCPQLLRSEYTRVDAKSMAICMKEIYLYSTESNDYFLINLMKSTTYDEQISKGTDADIAHKFGYEGENYGYHDMAIVYAKEPYILSIFSRIDARKADCNDAFIRIATLIEHLHGLLHE